MENRKGTKDWHITARVPADDFHRLREIAEAEHRTVSQELRRMIEQRIAEAESDLEREAA